MSGPKVINIEATRRQQQRLCDSQLRQLRNAVAAWQDCMKRAGKLDEAVRAQAAAVVTRLEALRESDLTAALRELPSRIQFFHSEEAASRKAIVDRSRSLRDRRRRVEQSAAMVARELQEIGVPPLAELREAIQRAGRADDGELAYLEASVQRAVADVARMRESRRRADNDERLSNLAAAFTEAAQSPEALHDWVVAKAGKSDREREKEDRLTALLAEVETWDDEGVAQFVERAQAISLEPKSDRRELLTDSLILDLAAYRKNQGRRKELADRLREALASLEPYQSVEAVNFRKRLEQELASSELIAAESLATEAEAWSAKEARREDSKLRRDAVLTALSELGYEVREGMAVAWAESGRIVVRKPNETNYGVEFLTVGEAAALQARVVAFDHPGRGEGDRIRDKEVEESWCLDLARMQRRMRDVGYEAAIQKAAPAGSVKLKVVSGSSAVSRTSLPRRVLIDRSK